jgi:hypothetical protein
MDRKDNRTCRDRWGDKWWIKLVAAPLLIAVVLFFMQDVNAKLNNKIDKSEHAKDIASIHKLMDERFDAVLYQQNLILDIFGVPQHKRSKKIEHKENER